MFDILLTFFSPLFSVTKIDAEEEKKREYRVK